MGSSPNTNDFITKAKQVHGDKYDYSKVEYSASDEKVCIICPKHGEFWQIPNLHLRGSGCPKCKLSKLEGLMKYKLKAKNIQFVEQYKTEWLGKQSIDFFIPSKNIAIECQGKQHFKGWKMEKESLNKIQQLDVKKYNLLKEHGITLYYFITNEIDENYFNAIYNTSNCFKDADLIIETIYVKN